MWALLAGTSAAQTQYPIEELAVYTGPVTTETTVERVADPAQAEHFVSLSDHYSAGYSRKPHWLRFTLQAPPADVTGERVLHIVGKPSFLGSLILYQPTENGFMEWRNGMTVPMSQRPFPDRHLSFVVEFEDDQPQTFYLRMQTPSSAFLDLTVWRPIDYTTQTVSELLLIGIYLGLLVAGAVNTLWHRQWINDPLQRTYLLFLVVMFIHFLGTSGLTVKLFFPENPAYAWLIVATGSYVVSATLVRLLIHAFDMHNGPTPVLRIFQLVFWAAIGFLPAPFLGFHSEAAQIMVWLGTLALSIGTGWSLLLIVRGQTGSIALLIANLVPLLGALITSLVLLGFLPGSSILFSTFQVGLLGSLAAFQILLAQRRQWLEKAYAAARREIRQAEQTAQWERARADEQQQFMSMLTHELRTPLSLIRLRLDAEKPSKSMQAYAQRAVSDMDAIIDRCAIASRIQEGIERVSAQPQLIVDVLDQVISSLKAEDQVKVTWHGDIEGELIEADPVLLRTVLSNLLDNAIKYSKDSSHVGLVAEPSVFEGRDGFRLRICNNIGATGLPDPARVFEKYYRGRDASRVSGSGLGLYIVHNFVRRMGGNVGCEVTETPNKEVCFELWLPKTSLL